MDKEKLRVEILESIYEDYADREVLPHYGLIPDWYLRYKDLSKLVIEYLNMPWSTQSSPCSSPHSCGPKCHSGMMTGQSVLLMYLTSTVIGTSSTLTILLVLGIKKRPPRCSVWRVSMTSASWKMWWRIFKWSPNNQSCRWLELSRQHQKVLVGQEKDKEAHVQPESWDCLCCCILLAAQYLNRSPYLAFSLRHLF